MSLKLFDEDAVVDTVRKVIALTGLRDVCVDASIDGDRLSLDTFPIVDTDNHANGELLDDNKIG